MALCKRIIGFHAFVDIERLQDVLDDDIIFYSCVAKLKKRLGLKAQSSKVSVQVSDCRLISQGLFESMLLGRDPKIWVSDSDDR